MSSIVVAGDTSGSVTISAPAVAGTPTLTLPTTSGTIVTSANISSYAPNTMKNRIINGAMQIDQRNAGASQSVSNGATAYTVDRWFMLPVGNAVTGQRVSNGSGGYNYQMTGAASVTSIYFGQRIEAANSYDMAGQTATLSVSLANSTLTSVAWTAYYANSTDNFSAVTSIASGTFTVNSTLTRYSTQISIPSAATTGIQIVFNVGAQTSGTWTISNAQLEVGSSATSFEWRPYGMELALCQRYYYQETLTVFPYAFCGYTTNIGMAMGKFPQIMRATPTMSVSSGMVKNVPSSPYQNPLSSMTPDPVSYAFNIYGTFAAGISAGQSYACGFTFTSSAEL